MLVDNEFYDFFKDMSFIENKDGYVSFVYNGKTQRVHRFIINCPDDREVDHKDGNVRNNQLDNLRICNRQDNQRNRLSFENSSSKYKGVCFYKSRCWEVQIRRDIGCSEDDYKGMFSNEDAAANCYNYWAKKYFGEFAYLNDCPVIENWQDYRLDKNKTSKYRGVCFDKNSSLWLVQIWDNNSKRNIVVGRFRTEIEAARAYNEFALKFKKKKARLNIIE